MLPPEEALNLPDEDDIRRDVRPFTRSSLQPPVVVRSSAVQLKLHTNRGQIVIDLFGEDAPQMVESFAKLAENGFFRELMFHRVVGDFVIQGGDPTGTGWGDAGYTLRSEWNPRRYGRGTVGIAHSGKDTGSCQLFITQAPQPHLDARYTIWGEVVSGMEVVDRIQRGDRFRAEVTRNGE
jgi:cyclophilin family peptidyl-prolyl cis-trans isomerase